MSEPEVPATQPEQPQFKFESEANDTPHLGVIEAPSESPPSSPASSDQPPAEPPAQESPAPGATPLRGDDGKFLPKRGHSPHTIQAAKHYGLTDAQISGADPDELRDWVSAAGAIAARQAPQAQPQPAADPLAALGINRDDYDPGLMKVVEHLAGKVTALEAHSQALLQERQAQAQSAEVDRIEAAFAGLPDKFKKVVGEGTHKTLAAESPEFEARRAIVARAALMPGHDMAAKMKAAAEALYGRFLSDSPTTEANPYTRRWMEGALARPTQRTGAADNFGVERARRGVAEWLRAHGVDQADTTTEDFRR